MWNIDVEECLGTKEIPKPRVPMIKTRDWDAELAFRRLKIVRSIQDALSSGINKNSVEIPPAIAEKYENVYAELKTIEKMEAETVKWGR